MPAETIDSSPRERPTICGSTRTRCLAPTCCFAIPPALRRLHPSSTRQRASPHTSAKRGWKPEWTSSWRSFDTCASGAASHPARWKSRKAGPCASGPGCPRQATAHLLPQRRDRTRSCREKNNPRHGPGVREVHRDRFTPHARPWQSAPISAGSRSLLEAPWVPG